MLYMPQNWLRTFWQQDPESFTNMAAPISPVGGQRRKKKGMSAIASPMAAPLGGSPQPNAFAGAKAVSPQQRIVGPGGIVPSKVSF
jgi:hypothetical protein